MKKVLILGAGIQGVCAALALKRQGYNVTVIEKAEQIISRTSLNHEGHVHMGFTYALDRTGKTGEMMMHSALKFSAAMEQWVGKIDWERLVMDPCHYLIHRDESMMSEEDILAYYQDLQDLYSKLLQESDNTYLGQRPEKIFKVLDRVPESISGNKISRAILTTERTIEVFRLRDLIVEHYGKQNIATLTKTEVTRVARNDSGFTVSVLDQGGQEQQLKADLVINCLWNNRIAIDETMGISTINDPLYRFKVGLLGKVEERVPNATVIAGAFGNISPRLDGTYAYISWHTDSVRDMTTDGTSPDTWERYFTMDQTKELQSNWVKDCIRHMSEIVPSVAAFKPVRLLPGVIVSTGKTDISDKNSAVHNRSSQMGIFEFDGYYSINTGKFSSAPLLAGELIECLETAPVPR